MKYLVLMALLVGCGYTPENLEGKCFRPFNNGGATVKVIECTNLPFYSIDSNYCVVSRPNIFDDDLVILDTIFVSRLDGSLETTCPPGL